MTERGDRRPAEDESLSREEEREVHDMSLDPHVQEAERVALEHAEELAESEHGAGVDIDTLLDHYSAALKEAEAHPDDQAKAEAAVSLRERLVKANVFRLKTEQMTPTVLAEAQVKGDQRFERAQRAREARAKARETRAEDRLVKERAQAFFEFLEMFDQARRQVEANIKRLPPASRGQFRTLLNEIRHREETFINERIREGIDFELLLRNPTDLDIDSWNDFVSRMQKFSTEMIELNHDIREVLEKRSPR